MIPMLITAITISSVLTCYNFYRFKRIRFLNMLLTFSLLMLFSVIFFFTFDKELVHSVSMGDLENVTDATFEDIDQLTTISSSSEIRNKEFKKDLTSQSRNRDLFIFSFFPILIFSMLLMFLLRITNKKEFVADIQNVFFNVAFVKAIQLYFIFTFKNNYKNQSVEEIRKTIINKFKDV